MSQPDYDKIAESIPIGGDADSEVERLIAEGRGHISLPVTDPKYQGLAEQKGYSQANPASRIQAVNYTHEALIDVMLAEPTISQAELAKRFDYKQAWISRIIGSDAFQAALAKRRDDVMNPIIAASLEEKLSGLAHQSAEIIAKKLEDSQSVDVAFKALELSAKSLGYGARAPGSNNQQNNFTIVMPGKAINSADWMAENEIKKVGNG